MPGGTKPFPQQTCSSPRNRRSKQTAGTVSSRRPEPTPVYWSVLSGLHASPDAGPVAAHKRQLFAARTAEADPIPTLDALNWSAWSA